MIIAIDYIKLRQITEFTAQGTHGYLPPPCITRVIVFAVRPFALLGRVRGKPAACIAVTNRVLTVPCSVFLCLV